MTDFLIDGEGGGVDEAITTLGYRGGRLPCAELLWPLSSATRSQVGHWCAQVAPTPLDYLIFAGLSGLVAVLGATPGLLLGLLINWVFWRGRHAIGASRIAARNTRTPERRDLGKRSSARKDEMPHLISSLCLAFCGVFVISLGLYFFWSALRLRRDGVQVTGNVVGTEDIDGTHFRVVEFVDHNGVSHRCRLKIFVWGDPPPGRAMS